MIHLFVWGPSQLGMTRELASVQKLAGYGDHWSVRISEQYRARGDRSGETVVWIRIGTHNESDKLFA